MKITITIEKLDNGYILEDEGGKKYYEDLDDLQDELEKILED